MKKRTFSPHYTIARTDDKPYLRRWFLTPWSDDDHPWKQKRLRNTYLHHILESDDDRALHDHPWNNLSIVLWGGYVEHVFQRPPVAGLELPPTVAKRRRMFHVVRRNAELAHRLELIRRKDGTLRPAWTIFITGRKRREWGFWCTRGAIVGEEHFIVNNTDAPINISLRHNGLVAFWMHHKIYGKLGGCRP